MARTPARNLTDRESEIMNLIWKLGSATADQIRSELNDELHDSSVRTMLRILEEKGFITHERTGRSFIYRPAIKRDQVQRKTLSNVIRQFFSGSPQDLVMRLLEDEQLSASDLAEMMSQVSENSKQTKSKSRDKQK